MPDKPEDFLPDDPGKNWPEGMYMGTCKKCRCRFQGPKREPHCHPCHRTIVAIAEAVEASRRPDVPLTIGIVQERVARAWAGMDGRGDRFDACKADPAIEEVEGRFDGYMSEAMSLLEASGLRELLEEHKVVSG